MNYSLLIAGAGLLLQLISLVYFFGVFLGSFNEFKEHVKTSLARLEAPYFSDVKVMRRGDQVQPEAEPARAQRELQR
ncbi:MAG: hypothetical protein LAP21_08470 [Acidobacteriia bacterium]|nr:hypothetical protein [Terriglobia bacterium]